MLDKVMKEMDFDFGKRSQSCGRDEPGRLVDFHRMGSEDEEMGDDYSDEEMGDDYSDEEMSASSDDSKDTVTMDVPFMIRIFELIKESIEDDAGLHHVADMLISLSQETDVITMDNYEEFEHLEDGYDHDNDEHYDTMDTDEEDYDNSGDEDYEGYYEDCEMSGPITIDQLLKLGEGGGRRNNPQTQSERKATAEGGYRAKRSSKNLANSWTSRGPERTRSWKDNRKTQYKSK